MKNRTRADYETRIARVVEAIENNPAAAHKLSDLAALANFSPFHFHRLYRAMRGESVAETARLARLRRAAFALSSSRRSVISIAQDAGYESAQSFSRAFKALLSVSPTQFRRGDKTFAHYVSGPTPPFADRKDAAMKITMIDVEPMRAHGLRMRGPISDIPALWSRLWALLVEQGLAPQVVLPVGVCVDAPDEGGMVNYCAAAVLAPGAKKPAGLETVDVAGGRYAVYRHIGPYAGINAAFNRLLGEWLPSSGRELDDRPALELYRNSPIDTPANALITDLHLPVK